MSHIGFIGVGNMATAILGGILKAELCPAEHIVLFDLAKEKCAQFQEKGAVRAACAGEVVSKCDIVFLAVKPQNYEDVLKEIASSASAKTVFVSIAAGISTEYISSQLGYDAKVVRAMPNTPLLLGEGATALCCSSHVSKEEFETVKQIFEASGIVAELREEQMNAVIAVNGSSPAYVYLFAKAIIDAASDCYGIDREVAKRLLAQTLIGSAKMLTESGYSPDELIKMVSSPGGTTLKALDALYDHDFPGALKDAMERCTKRAEELGK